MANLNKLKKERELEVYQAYLAILIQEKICGIMEEKDISQRELAKRAGLGEAAVSRLLSDDRNLTLKTVGRVFHALGEKV
ncbi:MAG: helix-turn-helix transcriptional regulator, partial [Bacteriovoracales bacterium]|nr:helix-turn-helix transcriptional regulator [Bacteriovoracales bacterium]